MEYVTDKDRADLDAAADMVKDGKRLRSNVLTRIRQRRYRASLKAKALADGWRP